jgi:hypothetical protein
VVPSALDGALLAGAVTAAALAVEYRNDAAAGGGSLSAANGALAASIGCASALVLTRLAAGLVYRHWPRLWMRGGP